MRARSIRVVAATTASLFFGTTTTRAFSMNGNADKNTMTEVKIEALAPIRDALENSWLKQLSAETPENYEKSKKIESIPDFIEHDNRTKRPVYNGHYVLVQPTPLSNPKLILHSPDVAHNLLKLTDAQIESPEFVKWVSGNLPELGPAWATPYALSIMGTRYTHNCPYGTGVGYGDGRAQSIGEFNGYELQLKGGGTTPFCRNADGRAVLRSSIREFLASEAMWYMGVATTRALSLVRSESDSVQRPWYSQDAKLQLPKMDDPRLADYSDEEKVEILQQLRNRKADPNMLIREPCAITCRVAPSFTRIGHFDLFARRVEKMGKYDKASREFQELQDLVWHACYREFRQEAYEPNKSNDNIVQAATTLLEESADRLSSMVTNWVRVGFAQGNFNADNCLVGGHTMDYGPFGFMEEYSPLFAKWTGSGEHFGFMNQPSAGYANYQVLVESVAPVICGNDSSMDKDQVIEKFMTKAKDLFQSKLDETFRVKMGLSKNNEAGDGLWKSLESIMRSTRVDWTLFWRQLTLLALEFDLGSKDYEGMLKVLMGGTTSEVDESNMKNPFYQPLSEEDKKRYLKWIEAWRVELKEDSESSEAPAGERMKLVNPKYVLREWMLVDAYTDAGVGEYDLLHDLYSLIQHPYDDGTSEQERRYYSRADPSSLLTGGTAFMS